MAAKKYSTWADDQLVGMDEGARLARTQLVKSGKVAEKPTPKPNKPATKAAPKPDRRDDPSKRDPTRNFNVAKPTRADYDDVADDVPKSTPPPPKKSTWGKPVLKSMRSDTDEQAIAKKQAQAKIDERVAQNKTKEGRATSRASRDNIVREAKQNAPSTPLETVTPTAGVKVEKEAVRSMGKFDRVLRSGSSAVGKAVRSNPIGSTVVGALAIGGSALALNRKKKQREYQDRINQYYEPSSYTNGDIWPNQDNAVRGAELKAFNDPKRFTSSKVTGPDDIVNVPGLVGRLARTVRAA